MGGSGFKLFPKGPGLCSGQGHLGAAQAVAFAGLGVGGCSVLRASPHKPFIAFQGVKEGKGA